jgi:hypothetical protein
VKQNVEGTNLADFCGRIWLKRDVLAVMNRTALYCIKIDLIDYKKSRVETIALKLQKLSLHI